MTPEELTEKIERISELKALLFKFQGFIQSESARVRWLMREELASIKHPDCGCEWDSTDVDVEFLSVRPHATEGYPVVYVEWHCALHGSANGAALSVEQVASRARS